MVAPITDGASDGLKGKCEELVQFFGRHLVSWEVIDRPKRQNPGPITGPFNRWNASGFIISKGDEWWLITAGHVLDAINKTFANGRVVMHSRLFDCWALNRKFNSPLPFPINSDRGMILGDADTLDLAAMELGPLLAANLKENGLEALDERAWQKLPEECDSYFLLGCPAELIKVDFDDVGLPRLYTMGAVMLKIRRIADPGLNPTPHERFFGEIVHDAKAEAALKNLGGMSGGVIVGLKKRATGEMAYWPAAVQSGWYPDRQIIVGDYFANIVRLIEQIHSERVHGVISDAPFKRA